MECFCGCGEKVSRFPLGVRSVNKRGAIIASDVANVQSLIESGVKSPAAERYVRDGQAMLLALAQAVHSRSDPGPEAESATREFMRAGRVVFGDAALGRAVRESGMSDQEALEALQRGEFDPFPVDPGSEFAQLVRERSESDDDFDDLLREARNLD